MESPRLSAREIMYLILSLVLGLALFTAPPLLLHNVRQGFWLAMLVAVGVDIGFALVLYYLATRFPGETPFQYAQKLLGPVFGRAAGLAYVWLFLHGAALAMRAYTDFFRLLMPETPYAAFLVLLVPVTAIGSSLGIEVIARTGQVLTPIAIAVVAAAILLLMNRADPGFMLPLLPGGPVPALAAATIPASWFGLGVVFGLLVSFHPHPGQALRAKILGMCGGALLTGGLLAITIMVLGPTLAAAEQLPVLAAVRSIEVARFLERMELLLVTATMATGLVSLAVLLYAARIGLAQVWGLRDAPSLSWPLATLAGVLALGLTSTRAETTQFLTIAGPVYMLAFEGGPLLLLGLAALFRRRVHGRPAPFR